MSRFFPLVGVAGLVLIACIRLPEAGAADPPAPVGAKIADFTRLDATSGKPWSFVEHTRDAKATVVVFLNTCCPVCNAYGVTLAQLHKQYAREGVVFLGVNSHGPDTAAEIADNAKELGLPFPVLKDEGTSLADKFAVERAPTAFVLDASRTVRYAGRINDQFAPGAHKNSASTRELGAAIDAVLEGREVKTPSAPAVGCKLTRPRAPVAATNAVTYHKDIVPIVQDRCQECHRSGEAGPFALTSYKQARGWADMIREVVSDGTMPPWHADAPLGHFQNDRRLSPDQKKTLLSWLDAGCPEGDPKDAPPAKIFVSGWRLDREPDQVLKMTKPIEVPASSFLGLGMRYEYVPAGPEFTEDKWITGVEVRPDYRAVVHHIIVFILPPRKERQRLDLDNFGSYMLAAYVPGDAPVVFPEGMARKIAKGSQLLFEMHYTPNGKPGVDQSMVGLVYAKGPPRHEIKAKAIKNDKFVIPAGAANHEVKSSFTPGKKITILSFTPHMHVRGKAFRFEAEAADKTTELLLNVPRYDFNWQARYLPNQPKVLPAGSTIRCTGWFDNSPTNPVNPDPKARVRWGQQTWDEMMIGFVDYYEED